MKKFACVVLLVAGGAIGGCADPNTVVFVTNSSVGINFDSTPPTANIAYDRTEGFIGPRFSNGGTPPAVASIETGGTIFDPKVRQTYATGAAANKATGVPNAPSGPSTMEGQKSLMFFGTTTTVGLKVGFGTSGAPDSLLFGFRRKEASVIPLAPDGKAADGTTTAVYPSVLAAIDTATVATTAPTTGLTSRQFFATGQAAEALATNPMVQGAFVTKAVQGIKGDLTDDQITAARSAGAGAAATSKTKLDTIVGVVTKADGTLDTAKLKTLVTNAQKINPAIQSSLANFTTVGAFRDRIAPFEQTVNTFYTAAQQPS